MFARSPNALIPGVALATAALVVLIVGAACNDPDYCDCGSYDAFATEVKGARVVPPATDTTPSATAMFNTASLAYAYVVTTPPAGTIDSIALYEVASQDPLPASATAILCAGAAACASTSGTATLVAPATAATLKTSLRGYRMQMVFFTTTAQKAAGGAMRGTPYPNPL